MLDQGHGGCAARKARAGCADRLTLRRADLGHDAHRLGPQRALPLSIEDEHVRRLFRRDRGTEDRKPHHRRHARIGKPLPHHDVGRHGMAKQRHARHSTGQGDGKIGDAARFLHQQPRGAIDAGHIT